MNLVIGFFFLLIIALLLYIIYVLMYSMIFGAPYAATREKHMNIMIDLLGLTKEDKFVDLGSGDGRFVIAAAKKGVKSCGYEMNPILVMVSRNNIRKKKL